MIVGVSRLRFTCDLVNSMESNTKFSTTSNRLLFDGRYGWVVDDWKDPSKEALAGGRGMFCILPLTKTILKTASQSVNLATTSAIKFLEKPDQFSPQKLQTGLSDQLQKLTSFIQTSNRNLINLKGNTPALSVESSQCVHHQCHKSKSD